MKTRILLATVALLALVCGPALSQPPGISPFPTPSRPLPDGHPNRSQVLIPPASPAIPPPAPQPAVTRPVPVSEKSLDQLLDDLLALRAQKAEIEKKEAELTKTIQKKAEKQSERMKSLGLGGPEQEGWDRVGTLRIEGSNKKDEKKIGKIITLVGLVPGKVLLYPKLEEARMRLKEAGIKAPTVEVAPGEGVFKDIVVRVGEMEP